MAEPTKTLYDNHNDNSINTGLWTVTTVADATISEISDSVLRLNAPGTDPTPDQDYCYIVQDNPGGHGMFCTARFYQGDSYNYGRVGITDTIASTNKAWDGNFYVAVQFGENDSLSANVASLYYKGYNIEVDNSPLSLTNNIYYDYKIYEGGDGRIHVYVGSNLLGILTGSIKAGSFIKYDAASNSDPSRFLRLDVSDSYDYVDNSTSGIPLMKLI